MGLAQPFTQAAEAGEPSEKPRRVRGNAELRPPEARAAVLAQAGVPREVADALLGVYDGIASGRVEHDEGTEQRRRSVALGDAVARMLRSMEANAGGLAA